MLSCLKFYSCCITKIEQVIFGPSGWGALGATDLKGLNLQNLLNDFGRTNYLKLGPTEITKIDLGFPSRCYRVQPFWSHQCANLRAVTHIGATELFNSAPPIAYGYIYRAGQTVEISRPHSFPLPVAAIALISGHRRHLQRALAAGFRRRQWESPPPLPP